jgi:hypothetical protein
VNPICVSCFAVGAAREKKRGGERGALNAGQAWTKTIEKVEFNSMSLFKYIQNKGRVS